MARHSKSECKSKRRYSTFFLARYSATMNNKISERERDNIIHRVYLCPICTKFHLTTKKKIWREA